MSVTFLPSLISDKKKMKCEKQAETDDTDNG